MSYSATRLTLYAILSAIETDLRQTIDSQFHYEKDISSFFGNELFEKAYLRFQKDSGPNSFICNLAEVLDYLDFSDVYQFINSKRALFPPDIGICIQKFTPQLDSLVPIRNRVAHSRPLNFDDLSIVLDIAQILIDFNRTFWPNLGRTLQELKTNPSFVLDLVIPAFPNLTIHNNLPVPDFDETGFIGRKSSVEQLNSAIKGPYPVITVVGEGGLGKSAIALKVAYDILDEENAPFDCVVWTSAKAATITAQEIVRIENAVTSSLGMFSEISKELAGNGVGDPIEEILSYLTEFRILLILDNLETIIDNRLSFFLEKLPTGSKVLTTSRIGLGEFERRIKLGPQDERESVQLLRALAKVRNLENLATASSDLLRTYCKKMKCNPGYIKWFVSAVQSGSRPEEVLNASDLFLNSACLMFICACGQRVNVF